MIFCRMLANSFTRFREESVPQSEHGVGHSQSSPAAQLCWVPSQRLHLSTLHTIWVLGSSQQPSAQQEKH